MSVAEAIAATSAEYCADRWPDGDRRARIDFIFDAVLAAIWAYAEINPRGGSDESPLPAVQDAPPVRTAHDGA